MTPTELAVQLWGSSEGYSRSQGSRTVRRIARDLFLPMRLVKAGAGN